MIEKPTPTEAEQRLADARHPHRILSLLLRNPRSDAGRDGDPGPDAGGLPGKPVTLVDALAELARQEQYLAVEDEGRRYDLGVPYGLLIAQLALALNGRDRYASACRRCLNCWPTANWPGTAEAHRCEPPYRVLSPAGRAAQSSRWMPCARSLHLDALLAESRELDSFRRSCDNLYERVRALFFLYAIHRFHMPAALPALRAGADSLCRFREPAGAPL